MKNSRNSTNSKPPARGGPSKDKEESDDDASTAGTTTTEGTLVDANVKDYQVIHVSMTIPLTGLISTEPKPS